MKFDKERIKSAVKFSVIGLAVAVGLGAVLGAVFALFTETPFITAFISATFFCYFIFCGWTLINLILNVFFSEKYITAYSVAGIYYGGPLLATIANKFLPDVSLWLLLLAGFALAFAINFIVIDDITYKKEKKQKEYEMEHQIFLRGKEEGFKEGYRRGYAEKETNCDEEKAIIRAYDFIIKRIQPDGKFVDSETGLVYDTKNPYEIEEIVDVIAHRRLTYQSVLKTILSKTREDGIYTDPETKEEFDMNNIYDREEIVTAEMFRLEAEKKSQHSKQ